MTIIPAETLAHYRATAHTAADEELDWLEAAGAAVVWPPIPDRPQAAAREATEARRDVMATADRLRAFLAAEAQRQEPDPLVRLQRHLQELSDLVAEVMGAGATAAQVVGAVRRGITDPDPLHRTRGQAIARNFDRKGQP